MKKELAIGLSCILLLTMCGGCAGTGDGVLGENTGDSTENVSNGLVY
jgi:hypothetical protein